MSPSYIRILSQNNLCLYDSYLYLTTKHYHHSTKVKMPLVVPGITNTGSGNSKDDWLNKLVGKKISDSHNETVFIHPLSYLY